MWWFGDGFWFLAAFAAVLGIGYGGFVALSPVVLATLFGVDRLGGLLGVLLTANGVGSALGPPAVGFVVDATGSYAPAIAALVLLGLAAYAALLPLGRHVTARNSNHWSSRDDLSNQPPQRFHRFLVRQARPLQSKDEMVDAQVVPVVSDLIYRRLGRPDDESVHPEFVPVASQRVGRR